MPLLLTALAPCRARGCTGLTYARGLCRGHYQRARAGEPEDLSPLQPRDGPRTGHLSVRLPLAVLAGLRAAQAATGASATSLVSAALEQHLANIA